MPKEGRVSSPVQIAEAGESQVENEDGINLIVGLGNPGIEYQFTPHNLGFLAVDRIADALKVRVERRQCKALTAQARLGTKRVVLAKPETFMNMSGIAVRELLEKYGLCSEADLIVIHDELDLPLGAIRIRERGSSAGHNGMKSIIDALGTQEFLRIRLGISPERRILKPFRKTQLKRVDEVLDKAAEAVHVILTEGRAAAMNRFNRKAEPED
jgi:PTH1 family peptidyl-tRNA hydrolase